MKNNSMRRVTIGILLLAVLLLNGCSVMGRSVFWALDCGPNTAFKIGPQKCLDKEVKVYTASFADYYGQIGETYIWSSKVNVNTEQLEDSLKNEVLHLLARIYAMNIYAKDHGIALSNEVRSQIASAANAYVDGLTEAQRQDMGIVVADVREMYERYGTALLVYNNLLDDIDNEVSEDEARIMDAYVMELTDAETENSIKERILRPDMFPILVQTYSEGNKGLLHIERGMYPKAFEEEAFRMENETIAGPIQVDDTLYYIYCVNKYNEELSEQNKAKIVSNRRQEILEGIVKEQNEKYYAQINNHFWEKLPVQGDGQDRSKLFFQVYDEYVTAE